MTRRVKGSGRAQGTFARGRQGGHKGRPYYGTEITAIREFSRKMHVFASGIFPFPRESCHQNQTPSIVRASACLRPVARARFFALKLTPMETALHALAILCLCLVLFSACGSASDADTQGTPGSLPPGSDLPSPTPQSFASLLETEQILSMTPPQVSDPVALAKRLKGLKNPATRLPTFTRNVGQENSFWIEDQDTRTYSQIHARLEIVTPHALFYVEDGQPFNQTALQASANAFEQQIYPTAQKIFGAFNGGAPITILNAAGLGASVGGLFLPQDEYSASIYPHSNQRDMFSLNLDSEIPGSPDYASALANEFQQLIDWHLHPLSSEWMNEGMGVLAQHLNNYTTGVERAFLDTPDTQLTNWPTDPAQVAAHAGASYLFLDYFVDHYGGESMLQDLLRDPAPPPQNFDDVLANHHYTEQFTDVLQQWLVANFIADPSIDSGEYGYADLHLPALMPPVVGSYPWSKSEQVSQYAANYYDLHPPTGRSETLHIQLSGSPTVRLVGNDPLDGVGEWWGNRANNMDSTLTRSFDLSHVQSKQAALQFSTWFDLQQGHDYAYVEVSTNSGASWTTLTGKFTTADNSNGLNWGNGYTGVSGGGNAPAWVQESIDLTPYLGKHIQLRFEEVTDNDVMLQGFAVDQISIPAINYQDSTADTGWNNHGFVHTENILPEHFLVQAIVYTGSTFTVQSMHVDLHSASGTLTIAHFGTKVTRVVLIVAAYALDTALQAHYQLSLRSS